MKLKNTFFSIGGALLLTIGFMSPTTVKADEIEEVIVVAQQVRSTETTPVTSTRLISAIMPAFTYSPGGYGGFIGYNERGAQTVHTTVYTNGIPANEPKPTASTPLRNGRLRARFS